MDRSTVSYLTFGIVLILAVVFDLGLLSRKGTTVSLKKALSLTLFWVTLAMMFFVFLWLQEGHKPALAYLSAYLMEWSLSVDNIFVFILIFTFFGVKPAYYARVLLIGILVAIFLRIVFITVGIVLVNEAHWVLYIGGVVLIISGCRLFLTRHDEEPDIEKDPVYRLLRRFVPLTGEDGGGRFALVRGGRKLYTSLFVVVVLLATTDIVFAVDSIPAVFGITRDLVVIFTSNIFAVLGLRSLFFVLRGAVDRFRNLQEGIAVVLIFVGLKMLVEYFGIYLPIYVSLLVILLCILSSILYSLYAARSSRS
ncbi:MAG TPA: TerC/Alx family metal homeostasis membrane protein [Puia sp.]|jgi:tellurite resistance protein TerC|nr:TerC/Alx family metal homeostasis membrane protein [Puia sp.]